MCLHCHVVTVSVEIRNLQALKTACHRLGWQVHTENHKHRWYGRWVDDSPLPRYLFDSGEDYQKVKDMSEGERCAFMTAFLSEPDLSISVPGRDYDIGVHKLGDQYQLAFDEWHGHINFRDQLAQAYAVELEKLTATQAGYTVQETIDEAGTVQLTCTSYTE